MYKTLHLPFFRVIIFTLGKQPHSIITKDGIQLWIVGKRGSDVSENRHRFMPNNIDAYINNPQSGTHQIFVFFSLKQLQKCPAVII